ncbi:trichohyalin-like [Mobula hypostoma]|uniref:trichohyalin-like n=1 Tax=Mobula hypostoma TaxID=723540 RepID=UPI002FC2E53E
MGTQGSGRKRIANRERLSAEDDTLNLIAREAEARLAAKRAARAEAREIRMKELERQQKEIYQVQKKYYGLDTKWGDIEQWMEDSEKYSRRFRRHTSVSDEDEWTSVGSRGSARADLESVGASGGVTEKHRRKKKAKAANGFDVLSCGSGHSKHSSRSSRYSDDSLKSAKQRLRKEAVGSYYSDLPVLSIGLNSKSHTASQNGTRVSAYDGSASHRYSSFSSRVPSEYNCLLGSGSRTSSRASSARASPVVEERLEKDFMEKGSRAASSLSAATLASLGGTSSRRGSGETTTSIDTEGSIREIKDSLMEVEEKYKKAMVSNAQLDNEKANLMYQVDTLREDLMEQEEQLAEMHRGYEEKTKELERQKHAYSILQRQFEEMKETLKEREKMLMEIKELNQKQRSFAQEISDLQETLEWKDKKIGALERQKEYSEAIRIDRDELRNEVVMLKERLKAHGLMTNGEAEHVGKEGSAHSESSQTRAQAETQQQNSSDNSLGETHGLQMRSEILKAVEQTGDMQNTGIDEQMEETGNREILMDNVEEKDKAENCEELTETDAPTMTVRDNGNADQIKCTASNLDDAEQSPSDTQNSRGKVISEGISDTSGFEEGMQSYGCSEGSESDPRVNGNQLQEKANQNSNDVENGADYQMILEKTQEIVQNVVEKSIQIFQQQMSGHELQEKSQDEGETISGEIGSVQVKEGNLTRAQERTAGFHQVEERDLGGAMMQETEQEQAVNRDIEFHSTVQESEICPLAVQGAIINNGEAGQLLIQSDQNDLSGSSGEGTHELDGAEKDERKEQSVASGFTVSEELEEVEEKAEKAEVRSGLIKGAALQELEENEEIACHPREEGRPVIRDEVNHACIHSEGQDSTDDMTVKERTEVCQQDREMENLEQGKEQLANEAELIPDADPCDGTRQLLQQQKVEGSLEHGCLLKMTLNEETNEAETEIESKAVEFEGEGKRLRENEDKAGELREDEEEHKGFTAEEIKGHGMDESDNKESVIEGCGTDHGTDKESNTCGILYDEDGWESGDSGHESERAVGSSSVDVDKGNGRDKDQGKEKNDNIVQIIDLYETEDSKEGINKCQEEYAAKLEIQGGKIEMEASGDINNEFKIKESACEFQYASSDMFNRPEEKEGEVTGPMESSDEVRGVEGCEVKGNGEEEDEVKSSKGEEEDEVKRLREEENEVINPREKEGDDIKISKEDNKVEDKEGSEVKKSREETDEGRSEEEDEIKSIKDNEVKGDEGDEVNLPGRDMQDIEGDSRKEGEGIKGLRGEDKARGEEGNVVIDSNVSKVEGSREESDRVKDPRAEADKERSEERDMAIGPKDEDAGEDKGPILAEDESIREDRYRVKDLRGEEESEFQVPREEEGGEFKEETVSKSPIEIGDEVTGPRDVEGEEFKSLKEDDEVVGPKGKEGEEVKRFRGGEDDVKSPRGEENNDFKDPEHNGEDKVNSGQKSEEQHGASILGRTQGNENEICIAEESEEVKLTDLLIQKEKLQEIIDEETECCLQGQVHESCKTNQLQNKNLEEICEGKPESDSKSIHEVMHSKTEQEMVRESETGVIEERTSQENLQFGDEEGTRQILDISSRNKAFEDNAQISEGAVSDAEEKDGRTRPELNEGQEEVVQAAQQDPAMGRMALEDVAKQIIRDDEKLYPEKGEGDSGTNQEQKMHGSEINKMGTEESTDTQRETEEQEIRVKDKDAEKGDQLEWDRKMNDILQDDEEASKSEEKRGETSAESEAERRHIVNAGSSEDLTPSTDCNKDAAYAEQKCQRSNSSSRQSNYDGSQQQDENQRGISSISGAEGNMKEAEEEMGLPETTKDSKRKSKSKDEYFRVNTFVDEKEALLEQIKILKAQLDEKTKSGKVEKAVFSDTILENGMDVQVIDVQRDANRQISEYKFKLTKTEQEITALEQHIIRLEGQVLRYKTAAENAEKVEDELKAEKRKLQREVRSALDKIEELEMSNSHLSKRLEKMKANRSALLSQQ